MIAKLRGIVDTILADGLIVDVGGVGYQVQASGRCLAALPGLGERVVLLIETHVREDHIHLYGFLDPHERDWFSRLLSVQGIGARVALGLLSVLNPSQLHTAILAGDKAALSRAPNIGARLAGRIVGELAERAGRIALGPAAAIAAGEAAAGGDDAPAPPDLTTDAMSALTNLGYGHSEAFSAVQQAARELEPPAELDRLIRAGLRILAP